ncbi:flagellar protein FlhE [Pseudomonas viridiflava]|uniref:flagellar protein FlhE n=1 Tax=Pseudomonas viridiflava TaxID=33069 RepID=UPI001787613E|nr:flagellar protein FlhE [Pseudomonas viridiflava]MBD8186786.1 flagellar protein FlhE [Pseudomonas viridiflava]MBD8200144.1 flagellar protein FlhE [Pseudomonas viridiflava]
MKRKGILGLAAAVILTTMGSHAFATSGSYSGTGVVQPTYSSNLWNTTNFPVLGNPPVSGRISTVSWNYTIGAIPAGATFTAYLCQGDTNSCIDVTSQRSGSTTAFTNRAPNQSFFLYHRIYRTTSFSPVSGGSAQVIVNYEF